MDAESMKVFALHRYFVQAETMRLEFDRQLGDATRARIEDDGGTKLETYMSLWYGCLYVVLESGRNSSCRRPDRRTTWLD